MGLYGTYRPDKEKKRKTNSPSDPLTVKRSDRKIDRRTDRQTNRQADRLTDRQTGRQTDGQTDRQTDRKTGRQADRSFPKCPRSIFVLWNMIIIFVENMSVNGKKVK